MLTLAYEDDNDVLEYSIFGDNLCSGSRIILHNDGIPCGVAVYHLTDGSIYLDRVGIAEYIRGKRVGDFFMRSILFKFSYYEMDIIVAWSHKYFVKLGFDYMDNGMIARDGHVMFPSSCGADCKS